MDHAREDDRSSTVTVDYEMEAAEALAGLSRFCSWTSDASPCLSQDQLIAAKHGENSSTLLTEKKIRITSSQLCGTTESNNNVRKTLTEAEKEARRVQGILANRESARQSICCRQDQLIAAKHSENSSTTEKTIRITSSQLCGTAESNNKAEKEALGVQRISANRESDRQSFCCRQDQPIAAKSSTLLTEKTIGITSRQLCRTAESYNKVKKKLTEAEKEARRVQRVLANRASARQSICRRQEMHLELTRKVNSLSEENKSLQKEKEQALKNYNMLTDRNKFLRLQIENKRNAESKEAQEQHSSSAEPASSAAKRTSTLLYNQPLVPLLCPSVVPFSNVLQFRYPPNTDVCTSSHHGQGISVGNAGPKNTFFVLPMPWLFPVHDRNAVDVHTISGSKEPSSAHHFSTSSPLDVSVKDNHQPSSRNVSFVGPHAAAYAFPEDPHYHSTRHHQRRTFLATEMPRCVPPVEHPRPMRPAQARGIRDPDNVYSPRHAPQCSPNKNLEMLCRKRKSDSVAVVEARRKRREVMQMKSVQNHRLFMQSMGN